MHVVPDGIVWLASVAVCALAIVEWLMAMTADMLLQTRCACVIWISFQLLDWTCRFTPFATAISATSEIIWQQDLHIYPIVGYAESVCRMDAFRDSAAAESD